MLKHALETVDALRNLGLMPQWNLGLAINLLSAGPFPEQRSDVLRKLYHHDIEAVT